jgi:hypothetical protein
MAAMGSDNPFRHGESQACACWFCRKKWLKHMLGISRAHSRARICNFDADSVIVALSRTNPNLSLFSNRFSGIHHKTEHHLGHQIRINADLGQLFMVLLDGDLMPAEFFSRQLHGAINHCFKPNGLQAKIGGTR